MPMKARYSVVNGEVIAEKRSGVRKLYVPDPLGSTVALLDNTQTLTDTFSYWPYGEVASRTGTTNTPFQFVGTEGYYHESTNRDYVRARTLDKAKGRWLTQDPIGFDSGDYNLYRYVGNDPISIFDPAGTEANAPVYTNDPMGMTTGNNPIYALNPFAAKPKDPCKTPHPNCCKSKTYNSCIACCDNNFNIDFICNGEKYEKCRKRH